MANILQYLVNRDKTGKNNFLFIFTLLFQTYYIHKQL